MPFLVGGSLFVHADTTVKMIPLEGPRRNQPFTAKACNKLDAKMNGKVLTAQGNSMVPVALAAGSAEPSFSLGLDTALVSIDYQEHVGDGVLRMGHNIVITATRPGLTPVTFQLMTCYFENGFGISSGSGEKLTDELSGKMRQLLLFYKGRTYDPYKLPGGVNLQ